MRKDERNTRLAIAETTNYALYAAVLTNGTARAARRDPTGMSLLAIFLLLISAVFHSGWNLLARHQRAEHLFLARVLCVAPLIGLGPAAWLLVTMQPLPRPVWLCMLASGVVFGLYLLCLARAYASGDFTVVYPITRSLPILLVGLGDVLLGRYPTPAGWAGMTLVAAACVLTPLHSLREVSARHYFNRNMAWVLLTALAIVSFTLIDHYAAGLAPRGPTLAWVYNTVIYTVAAAVYLTFFAAARHPDENQADVGWRRPALAAGLTYASYFLVLWAYQLMRHAGYVVAFRQASILIGVVLGIAWFRERGGRLRMAAAGLMVAGLVLIKAFG